MDRPMIIGPAGWYPENTGECKKQIEKNIDRTLVPDKKNITSVIVPHAGWYFCADISVNCIRLLKEKNAEAENVFIFGGHLSEKDPVVLETFDKAETPLGVLENNRGIIDFIEKTFPDIYSVPYLKDNTIEIVLPIIKYYFTEAGISAMYLPPNKKIRDLIEKLYDRFGKNSVFIGSTDLTHYGPNYGLSHDERKMSGIDWVKNINDKKYIDLLLEMKEDEALDFALKNHSACSPGASFGASVIAAKSGVKEGELLKYSTSYDKHPDDSFVGYAGIIY